MPTTAGERDEAHSDDALLRAFLRGDGRAFEELVRRYQSQVYALCRRYSPRPDDARDLSQRAFLRAFAAARRTRLGWRSSAPFPFRAWLFRIAINLGKNHARDRGRWQLVDLDERDATPDRAASAQARLEREEAAQRVRAAVVELPKRQREVFTLRVDAELPFADVARSLGITENNAKVTFHHAVKRLQEILRAAEEKS